MLEPASGVEVGAGGDLITSADLRVIARRATRLLYPRRSGTYQLERSSRLHAPLQTQARRIDKLLCRVLSSASGKPVLSCLTETSATPVAGGAPFSTFDSASPGPRPSGPRHWESRLAATLADNKTVACGRNQSSVEAPSPATELRCAQHGRPAQPSSSAWLGTPGGRNKQSHLGRSCICRLVGRHKSSATATNSAPAGPAKLTHLLEQLLLQGGGSAAGKTPAPIIPPQWLEMAACFPEQLCIQGLALWSLWALQRSPPDRALQRNREGLRGPGRGCRLVNGGAGDRQPRIRAAAGRRAPLLIERSCPEGLRAEAHEAQPCVGHPPALEYPPGDWCGRTTARGAPGGCHRALAMPFG